MQLQRRGGAYATCQAKAVLNALLRQGLRLEGTRRCELTVDLDRAASADAFALACAGNGNPCRHQSGPEVHFGQHDDLAIQAMAVVGWHGHSVPEETLGGTRVTRRP